MRQLATALHGPAPAPRQGQARGLRRRRLPWLRMGLLAAATVAGLAHVASPGGVAVAPEPGSPAALIAPPPPWQAVAHPEPLYGLEGIERTTFALEVRRHLDGAREDTLTFGQFGDTGFGLLRMTRGSSGPEPTGFYVALARQAASAGLSVVRSAQPMPLVTKLGLAEAAPLTLSGLAQDGAQPVEAACRAVRLTQEDVPFALAGWVCGSADQPATDAQVACLIDRLTVVGQDLSLKALFAEAEGHRVEGCRPAARVASARKT